MKNKIYTWFSHVSEWFVKKELTRRQDKCYKAATYIAASLKYDNGKAQKYIDAAKDSLYQAAIIFRDAKNKLDESLPCRCDAKTCICDINELLDSIK